MTELDQKLEGIIHDVMNMKIKSTAESVFKIHLAFKEAGFTDKSYGRYHKKYFQKKKKAERTSG